MNAEKIHYSLFGIHCWNKNKLNWIKHKNHTIQSCGSGDFRTKL